MSTIRFQRMLDIPGLLPSDVPNEHGTYVIVFTTNKKQNKYPFKTTDFNIISIT